MNWMINLIAKIGGIGKLWGVLDGYKTKVAGVAALLSGLAALVSQIVVLIEGKDAAAVWTFVQALPQNPAWILLLSGLGTLGIGHKLEKAAAPPAP